MTETLPKPRRRSLRFSLRALFAAVTVLACWLGYERAIYADRRACLIQIRERGAAVTERYCVIPSTVQRWFADCPIYSIDLPETQFNSADCEAIRRAFPEAWVEIEPTPVTFAEIMQEAGEEAGSRKQSRVRSDTQPTP